MTNMHIEFAIFYKYLNYQDFETNIAKANVVWYEVFGKTYNEGECPSDKLVIGSIDDKPVCCGTIDVYCNISLISCIASNSRNNDYETLLMEYIINYLKIIKINKINLNIDIDENSDRLINFYSKFGFVKQDDFYSIFEYNPYFEYRMALFL